MSPLLWSAIGVCLASGLVHLLLVRRNPRGRAHALFGGLCFVLVTLLYFDLHCYYASSPEAYLNGLRAVLSSMMVFWVVYAWFCHAYTGIGSPGILLGLTLWYVLLVVANVFLPGTLLFAEPPALRTLLMPWGETLTAAMVTEVSWLGLAHYATALGIGSWVLVTAARHARKTRRREGLALGLGASIVLLGHFSDGLVDVLSLNWIYTSELGFVAMVVIMNVRLARDGILAGRRVARAEEALRRSEGELRRAQGVARIGSWRYRRQSGLLECSTELYRLLGLAPDSEVRPEALLERIHPDDRDRVLAAAESILEGSPLDLRCRFRMNGDEHWVHGLGQPEQDAQGRIEDLVGTLQDVSDQVALENRLFQAQKMEAVGQLAGGVAHDFNNLLQVISGYCELAMVELPSGHSGRESVRTVAEAARRAATLVDQLLAFSRQQVLRLADLDVNEVTGAFMKTLAHTLGEHIRISFVPGHDLGLVRADRGQLEVVVMNLCVNARDAMPDGGLLTLETRNVSIDESYRASHPWAKPGPHVRLAVRDNGGGMDEATLKHVFEPFFTTKIVGKGTGLGLATVYGIVKQHEGMIDVSSEPGEGTLVEVYLPCLEEGAESQAPVRAAPGIGAEGAPCGSEAVLIVEDEDGVRRFAGEVLRRAGYRVLTARDGVEALQVAESDGEGLDLAVLDIILPGAGGRVVHEALSERFPRMRFLFVSGFSPDAATNNFVVERGLEFLQKPVSAGMLLRTVRRVLDASARP